MTINISTNRLPSFSLFVEAADTHYPEVDAVVLCPVSLFVILSSDLTALRRPTDASRYNGDIVYTRPSGHELKFIVADVVVPTLIPLDNYIKEINFIKKLVPRIEPQTIHRIRDVEQSVVFDGLVLP